MPSDLPICRKKFGHLRCERKSSHQRCSHTQSDPQTFRQLGWMISLQMVHSIRDRLNFSSSDSTVSSFPASPQAKHTAVWGNTGWRTTSPQTLVTGAGERTLTVSQASLVMYESEVYGCIYRSALPEQTRLLHPARSTKLFHVFAEVALAALGPHAGLTAPATCPSPPCPSQRLTARHPLCIQLTDVHTHVSKCEDTQQLSVYFISNFHKTSKVRCNTTVTDLCVVWTAENLINLLKGNRKLCLACHQVKCCQYIYEWAILSKCQT